MAVHETARGGLMVAAAIETMGSTSSCECDGGAATAAWHGGRIGTIASGTPTTTAGSTNMTTHTPVHARCASRRSESKQAETGGNSPCKNGDPQPRFEKDVHAQRPFCRILPRTRVLIPSSSAFSSASLRTSASLSCLMLGCWQGRTMIRQAKAVRGRLTYPRCVTPITIGLWSPVVILPPDWVEWDARDLAAVLAHEEEHARRRDPLVALVTLINRAVFWFHPLAWWLRRG